VNTVAARLAELEDRIAAAAERRSRDPAAIRLVGASKMQPPELLRQAYEAGLRRFGENRVQEGRAKASQLPADIEWHLLGPLQSNKVRAALELFSVFHAVDRTKIARALDAEAAARGIRVVGLLEVNIGGEASKHGFSPERLAAEIEPLATLSHLEVRGLMALPPPTPEPEGARPYFQRLRELRDALDRRPEWAGRLVELSIGMSDDFEVAVEEGATFVRVGSRLFGPRPAA